MNGTHRAVPERLRPRPVRRRSRRRLALFAALPVLLLPLRWWQLSEIRLGDSPALPAVTRQSLGAFVGTSPLVLDLDWVRHQVEIWPGVAAVDVRLELPGTLHVTARPTEVAGSIKIGSHWHGVAADGSFAAAIGGPRPPQLEGFTWHPDELARALAIAARLAAASGAEVTRVRYLTPADNRLTLMPPTGNGEPLTVMVASQPTEAERRWCEAVRNGHSPAPWSDLRSATRLVLGGLS
jgi:hypothetical protein